MFDIKADIRIIHEHPADVAAIKHALETIMSKQDTLAAELEAATAQAAKIADETRGLIAELAAAIEAQGNTSERVDAAMAALKTALQVGDDLVADKVANPPTDG